MFAATVVACYLFLWLAFRVVAHCFSAKNLIEKRSPILTWSLLSYSLVVVVFVVMAKVGIQKVENETGLGSLLGGLIMVVIALALEAICLVVLRKHYSLELAVKHHHNVVKRGPYRFVRHPLYLANIVGYIGVGLLLSHWIVWSGLIAQIVGFVVMAHTEETFLSTHLGTAYELYRNEVRWMFVPGIM